MTRTNGNHECPWCGASFSKERGLISHVGRKHQDEISESKSLGMTTREVLHAKQRAEELLGIEEDAQDPEEESREETTDEMSGRPPDKESYIEEQKPPEGREETKKHRDKFFSEAHPVAGELGKMVLPRIHSLAIALYFLFNMLMEISKGNFTFYMDWFRYEIEPLPGVGISLQGIFSTMSDMDALQAWFNAYGDIFFVLLTLGVIWLILFYFLAWRFAFKDYLKFSEGVETYEGRCYMRTDGILFSLWDALYRSPPRQTTTLWVKPKFWPPLNPFNPGRGLVSVELGEGERVEQRGLFELRVHELPYRRMRDKDDLITHSESYISGPITLEHARNTFEAKTFDLVANSRDLSLANADVRLQQLRGGSYLIPEELKQIAETEEEEHEKE